MLEVWEECAGDEESLLWKVVLGEMCVAFSRKPLPVWAEFDVCCKRIDAFRLAVGGAMADRIVFGESGREEGGGKRIKLEVVSGGDEV